MFGGNVNGSERQNSMYREFDRSELDRQYNNLARIPDHEAYAARWSAASLQTRESAPCRLDIAYGDRPRERLDLFFPEDPETLRDAPIHVFIHGGYWYAQAKENFSFVAQGLIQAGVIVAVLDYELCPDVDISEIVRQVRAALAWLWRNAAEFGGDPQRIFVSGHSAGGHLTAMSLATSWPAFGTGLPENLVKGGVTVGGVFDLEPIRHCFLNDILGLDEMMARLESPIHNLPVGQVSLVVAVGECESAEFVRQSQEFAAACTNTGIPAELMVIGEHHHISVMDELGHADGLITAAILRQIVGS